MHRFNAWANCNILAGVRQLTPEQLDEQQDGMYRPILGVLRHLAQVELGQVLTHSINHRADINQWLPRFGVASTQQDYINLVLSET